MTFTSLLFVAFAVAVAVLYFIIPIKYRWMVLFAGSAFFYAYAGLKFIPFLIFEAVITFFCAIMMERIRKSADDKLALAETKEEKSKIKEDCKKNCKTVLVAVIIIVLVILAYSKFAHYLVDYMADFLATRQLSIKVIVPLGISYFTFSSIGYILDIYWKRYSAEHNFAKYILYLMYFPHILQGPIPRYDRLGAQLYEGHTYDYTRMCYGIQLMLWGYFKKLVIADRLAIFVNNIYGDFKSSSGIMLVIATLFYSVQLYTDFSGCMDIAGGYSQILGISLDKNFRQPYFSQSVEEYWRRWHITLGKWFKDYLCMPVTVSKSVKNKAAELRKKKGSQAGKNYILIMSSIAVWLATGIWHGTGINYVVWGIWNGTLIVASSMLADKYVIAKEKLHIDDTSKSWQLFRILRTFVLAGFIPRIITRGGSMYAAAKIFKNIFTRLNIWELFDGSLYNHGLDRQNIGISLCAIAVLFVVSFIKEKEINIRENVAAMPVIARWILYYGLIFSIVVFGIYGFNHDASAFMYMTY